MINLLKETSSGQKATVREKLWIYKKRKDAYSMLQSWTCSRGWCRRRWRCRWVRTKMPITALCDSVTVSDFKPGGRGLNSRLRSILQGRGVLVLTHYLITWLGMDGQRGTHDGSSGRPGALLQIFFPTQNSSTPYLTYIHCFCDWGRRI